MMGVVWCTPHVEEHLTQSERTIANPQRYRRQRLVLFTSLSFQIDGPKNPLYVGHDPKVFLYCIELQDRLDTPNFTH